MHQAQLDAQAVVASFTEKLDSFANASFRGARMSSLSSLLTSDSADEFLDSVTRGASPVPDGAPPPQVQPYCLLYTNHAAD